MRDPIPHLPGTQNSNALDHISLSYDHLIQTKYGFPVYEILTFYCQCLYSFKNGSHSLATPNAKCGQTITSLAAGQLAYKGCRQPTSAGADGVTKSNRTTIDIHTLQIQIQLLYCYHDNRSERLVNFKQIDIRYLYSCFCADGLDCPHRSIRKQIRRQTPGGISNQAGARFEAVFLQGCFAGEKGQGRSIVDRGGIARSDSAVPGKSRTKLLQFLEINLERLLVIFNHFFAFFGFFNHGDYFVFEYPLSYRFLRQLI